MLSSTSFKVFPQETEILAHELDESKIRQVRTRTRDRVGLRRLTLLVLDIGCGSKPRGSVNCDLNLGKSEHHKFDYDVKKIDNFIRADAENLPFRNKLFRLVISSHCIEHLDYPLNALREFERVSSEYVVIDVPNNPVTIEHREHKYSWSEVSLKNFMGIIFDDVKIQVYNPAYGIINFIGKWWALRPLFRLIVRYVGLELRAIGRNNI